MYITIIGAGPGISNAIARLFGSKGYDIALVARSGDKLDEQVAELEAKGIKAMCEVADAGVELSLNEALTKIEAAWGYADMILYNAYALVFKTLEQDTWDEVQQQMNVNVGGAFNLLKRVLPHYRKQNKGKIFFTGGGLALYPQHRLIGLSMGKAALRNLVSAVASSVQGSNVHIATVTIRGFVNLMDPRYNPDTIAQQFWELFLQDENSFKTEVIF